MAPKKPKQPSMLTRQRQLRNQQQQVKRAASKQLPPAGGSGANRPKAVAQRTATAVGQRANQDMSVLLALADNMRRNKARADRQIPADKSPSVRRVGPGGANPKPQGQLPPGQRGGEIRARGGALANRPSGGSMTARPRGVTRTNSGGPVQPVSVRDLGNSQPARLSGQRGLPGGTGGSDRVRGSDTRTGQPGANRAALPAGRPGGAMTTRPRVNGLGTGLAMAAGEAILGPVARAAGTKLGQALRPLGQAIDDRMPGTNSKDEARRNAAKRPLPRMTPAQNRGAVRLGKASPSDVGRRPAAPRPSGSNGGGSSSPAPRSSGGSQARSSGSSARSSAPSTPRFNGTVEEGRQMWAEKYSSEKYKGQAIQKEAKALLEKLKVKKGDNQSAANKAGWDGNKNY